MPQIIVNATEEGLDYDAAALASAIAELPARAPVVILLHGFKYAPGVPGRCPHRSILAERAPRAHWKVMSWPRHLGFGRGTEGLVIALGWNAIGSIWQAYRRAGKAGRALAELIDTLDRPVHMLGHSLGARVALSALCHARAGSVGRVVLIAGAELRAVARAAMVAPAGRTADVLNVTSAENAPFDLMLEAVMGFRGRAIGAGLDDLPGWVDLPVDREETRARLARIGYRIAPPCRRVCHWSLYLRPGLFPLYGSVIRGALPVARLAAPAPAAPTLLPFAWNTSS
jgi:pimeloyl-ACP methyl ester carboxylesterase